MRQTKKFLVWKTSYIISKLSDNFSEVLHIPVGRKTTMSGLVLTNFLDLAVFKVYW